MFPLLSGYSTTPRISEMLNRDAIYSFAPGACVRAELAPRRRQGLKPEHDRTDGHSNPKRQHAGGDV